MSFRRLGGGGGGGHYSFSATDTHVVFNAIFNADLERHGNKTIY